MKRGRRKESSGEPAGPVPALVAPWEPHWSVVPRRYDVAAAILGVILLIVVGIISTSSVTWSADNFTDMNILMAGANFARHGLFKLHLLPVHYITPTADAPLYYLHYPPLADVISGVVQSLGVHSLWAMRMLCGTLCVAGLLCACRAFTPVIGPLAALCGAAFAGTSGFFLAYAISLHHAYNVFFVGLFLLLFLRAIHSVPPARGTWAGAWVVLLLASLVSYEFILYPQVFAWVYTLGTRQLGRRWKMLLILGTAPVLGVGLHFLQNCWAVGYAATMADGLGYGDYQERGRWFWLTLLPERLLNRSQQSYYWAWPALVLLAPLLLARPGHLERDTEFRPRAGSLLLGLVLAPLGWYLVMPRHAWIHPHVTTQLFPLALALVGWVTAWAAQWLFGRGQPIHSRVLGTVMLLVLLGGQAQSIRWRLALFEPGAWDAVEAIGPDALPPKTALLHNSSCTAQFAYYTGRPAWRAPLPHRPFPACVFDLQRQLPEDWKLQYYIFFGPADQQTFQLLASTCEGRRLRSPRLGKTWIVLFDISPLHLPESERTPLPPEVRERQLSGAFPEWQLPGFTDRLERIVSRYPTQEQS